MPANSPKKPNPRRIDVDKLPEHIRKLNPHLYDKAKPNVDVQLIESCNRKLIELGSKPMIPAGMNQTESRWMDGLEADKRRGMVFEYAYEPFAMRLADHTTYTPDFVVVHESSPLTLAGLVGLFQKRAVAAAVDDLLWADIQTVRSAIETAGELATVHEIKGGKIWEKNRIKFKVAREMYPWITFKLWQWKNGEWTNLI